MPNTRETSVTSGAPFPSVLCVDLDSTLVRTNTLVELFLYALRRSPWLVFLLPLWLIRGKAELKKKLALIGVFPVDHLPFNEPLIGYLKRQKEKNRKLILATASDEIIARRVAEHLGLFDQVLASDGANNLNSGRKAVALVEAFGEGDFAYAGNGKEDLEVWSKAGSALVVGVPNAVKDQITIPIEADFQTDKTSLKDYIRAVRPHHWVKNVLLFVPILAANGIFLVEPLLNVVAGFVCICVVASGVYVVNDLFDLEADRHHPRKQSRPFASGRIAIVQGLVIGPMLITAGLLAGFFLAASFGLVLLGYVILTAAYTVILKTFPLVDVFTLAILYMMRIVAGGVLSGFDVSIWLLAYSGFVFLALAFLKRAVESQASGGGPSGTIMRRGFFLREENVLAQMGIGSSFASAVILSLYLEADMARAQFANLYALWGFVPLSLFWLLRLWLSASRGYVEDDPLVYAARDWVSRVTLVVGVLIYLAAL